MQALRGPSRRSLSRRAIPLLSLVDCNKVAEAQFHPVMSDARLDAAPAAEASDVGAKAAAVAADDLRAAMGEDRAPYGMDGAPVELGADRRVAYPSPVAAPEDGSGHCRTIADVKIDPVQRCHRVADFGDIRHIKDASAVGGEPVSHSGTSERMLDGKGLEFDTANIDGFAFRYDPAIGDRIGHEQWPRLTRGVDRTRRSVGKPARMIRASVRQHDRRRLDRPHPTAPVGTTIDENSGVCPPYQQRAMASVSAGSSFDVAARAEET
jgi:hypothetical protein